LGINVFDDRRSILVREIDVWAHAMRPYEYFMVVVGFTRIAVKKINLGSILVNVAGFVDYLDRFATDEDC
jgi:hypothetical protein